MASKRHARAHAICDYLSLAYIKIAMACRRWHLSAIPSRIRDEQQLDVKCHQPPKALL
jgi:hypothetical protein